MPSIKDNVKKNQQRIASLPAETPETDNNVQAATQMPLAPVAQNPAPPSVGTGLPVRGVFPPTFTLDSDFNTAEIFRQGLVRSGVFPFPPVKTSTLPSLGTAKTVATPVVEPVTTVAAPTSAGSVALAQIQASGKVDSTQPYFAANNGGIPPQIVGTTASIFTYTSTTTTVTITWSAFKVLYSDNTSSTIASGSQSITGLTSNTTYYYYPYLPQTGVVTFAAVTGGAGSPAILYTPQSPTAAQIFNNQAVTPLASAGIQAITPSTGSGGGSGGGSGICVRDTMIVLHREKGEIPLNGCVVGDFLKARYGWTEIKQMRILPQEKFVRLETDLGAIEVTPTHHVTTSKEEMKPAAKVSLSDFLIGQKVITPIKCIRVVNVPDGKKVTLTCEPESVFFCGEIHAELLAHNAVPLS